MDNDTRRLKFKKTTIIVHFSQEIDEHGVVQTTARTDFLQKEPGICTPLTVEATWNSREAALQKLIHKVNALIVGGTLTYEELRFCPSEAMIYVTKRPKPADPLLDILPKLLDCFKTVTQGDLRDQVPEIKKIEGELSNCLKKAQEKLETPQPVEMALNHIMTTIEASSTPRITDPPPPSWTISSTLRPKPCSS